MNFHFSSHSFTVSCLLEWSFYTAHPPQSDCIQTKCHLESLCWEAEVSQDLALWPFYSLLPRAGLCFLNSWPYTSSPVLSDVLGRVMGEGLSVLLVCRPVSFFSSLLQRPIPPVRPEFESWPCCLLCGLPAVAQPSPNFIYKSFSWG